MEENKGKINKTKEKNRKQKTKNSYDLFYFIFTLFYLWGQGLICHCLINNCLR